MKRLTITLLVCSLQLHLLAQNVGIGTTTPVARLHVADSNVLFNGYQSWFLSFPVNNPPASDAGVRMMWYPGKAAFRAGAVSGPVWDKDSIGRYSFAAGLDVKAKGDWSAALGVNNSALNWYEFTAGAGNTVQGVAGVAIGYNNTSRNTYGVALGNFLIAKAVDGFVTGSFNDTADAQYSLGTSFPDDRLFQVGNGSPFGRSNAITILRNGNTGIGVLIPKARLHVDSAVVFTGRTTVPPTPASPPVSGAGIRMMWYPDKAAFRSGVVDGTQWDKDSIGLYSFAAGINTKAKGEAAVALGAYNSAKGDNSTALGYFSSTNDNRSTAIGYVAVVNGFAGTAIGFAPQVDGVYSHTIGNNNYIGGSISFALGDKDTVLSDNCMSLGYNLKHTNTQSIAVGFYNDISGSNKLFEIGNGTSVNSRSNAVTVLQNGSTLITAPATLPGTPANPPATGNGYRMMWYADKAAFRAGQAIADSWDKDNIGIASFAAGSATKASGVTSFAGGTFSYATGETSTAIGFSVQARARGAAAFGIFNDISDNPNPVTDASSDRIFQVGNGSGNLTRSNAITILRNGNIGIGTFTPGFLLNFPSALGDKVSFYGESGSHYGIGIQSGLLQVHTDFSGSDIAFGFGSSFAFTERVRIKGNGNMGIGNSNPTRPLSFPAALGEKILLYPGGAGEVGIGVYGNELRLHCDNPGSSVSFGTQDNGGVFTQAGRFQISAPYALFVNGSIWANGTTYASDERFKQNITAIASPLERLLSINGVEYEMRTDAFSKNNFQQGRQMGLLAQNVEKVVPEAVHELDGYKGVDYARLVPLLVESIKEQQKQIEELKNKISQLQNK